MSDLQKSFVKARLAKLPSDIPVSDEVEETARMAELQEEDDGSSASSASSTGTVRPSSGHNLFARPSGYVQLSHYTSQGENWLEFRPSLPVFR